MKTVREVVFNMDRQHIHIQKISVPREENKMEGEKCLEVQQKKNSKIRNLQFSRTHHILGGRERMENSNVVNPNEVTK